MFNNITIKGRLAILVGTLSTLMTLVGVGGIYALSTANDALQTLYAGRLVPVGQLDQAIRAVMRSQLLVTNAVVLGEASYVQVGHELNATAAEAERQWAAYLATRSAPAEQALAREAQDALRNFRANLIAPELAALAGGDTARLQELVRGRMRPLFQAVRQPADALIALQLTTARDAYAASMASYRRFLALSIGTLAFGLVAGFVVAVWLIRSVSRPISHAVEIAEAVAAGDLTHAVRIEANDESARLLGALRRMQTQLTTIVSGVRDGTDAIHTASREIALGNNDLSARTEDQAASLEQTAASMEQLTATVRQNADHARQASQLVGSASDHAAQGGVVVREMVQTMADIRASSARIVDIISVIDGIAFQTNILALNAAVEAARAGEQGRGFAVVATEVRNLAQRSASAAREIKQLIGDATDKVGRGSNLMDQTGATMARIVASVRKVAEIIDGIAAASHEQSDGIGQVNQAIVQIDESTQRNAALVEQSAAAAQSLQDQADTLAKAVSVFRMGKVQPAIQSVHGIQADHRRHFERLADV